MANTKVKIVTSEGDITLELFEKDSPLTTANFLRYVDAGTYEGTVFHRVIKDFMIQGGGLSPELAPVKTFPPVKNEAANGVANEVGTIAMARTSVIDSATCQFFINTNDNDFLNHRDNSPSGFGYCVFGKVTDGMDTVRKIEGVPTGSCGMHDDVPLTPVLIKKVSRI